MRRSRDLQVAMLITTRLDKYNELSKSK